jgi:catechol 2,3-dioxygenase-like lactoylglutathione lyase family enzyme
MEESWAVHHVAIGVKNLQTMRSFYQDVLEFNKVFAETEHKEHKHMREVLRMPNTMHSMIMFNQEAGGIFVELIRMTNPAPRPIRRDFRYGDIGVTKTTIAVSDVEQLGRELEGRVNFCSKPKSVEIPGWGDYHFLYCRDPEGNLIELASGKSLPVPSKFGGVRWIGVSVTNLKRSMSFYQKHLGFDTIVIESHERFSGLVDEVSGANQTKVRSCLLASSRGDGMIELLEVFEPRGRSIPFSTSWGDFGYLQVCLHCDDIRERAAYCEKEGIEFLSGIQLVHDKHGGGFFYFRDPDGIPIEFLAFNQEA